MTHGVEDLEDRTSAPSRIWNRIPDDITDRIITMALDHANLSPRELAVKFTDTESYYVSEASVYRLLKAHDLITSPAANAKRGSKATPISPMAWEAVKRIDALFDVEREINGLAAEQRLERRRKDSQPLAEELHDWLQTRAKLSRSSPVAEAIDYMLKRWDGFTSFLEDGRICLTNNAAERALRGLALGRKSWLFAGSDRGAERVAFMATLIMSAKLNDIDRRPGLPTFSPTLRIRRSAGSSNCCRGTGHPRR